MLLILYNFHYIETHNITFIYKIFVIETIYILYVLYSIAIIRIYYFILKFKMNKLFLKIIKCLKI